MGTHTQVAITLPLGPAWARHFARNYLTAIICCIIASQIPSWLWQNFKYSVKTSFTGPLVVMPVLVLFLILLALPLSTVKYARSFPRELLIAEHLVTVTLLVSLPAYSVSVWLFYPQIASATGPVALASLLGYISLHGLYQQRAMARFELAKRSATASDDNNIDTTSKLCLDGLHLYNKHLQRSVRFGIRDIERFYKPIALNLVADQKNKKHASSDQIQMIIDGAQGAPEQFVRSLKTILDEPFNAARMHEEIEIYHHGMRQFLSDNLVTILGIIAIFLGIIPIVQLYLK